MLKLVIGVALVSFGLAVFGVGGCVHRSGGTWMFDSAPLPEGWPELSPVGEVVVRSYPVYRAAIVSGVEGEGTGRPFGTLFGHIKDNGIAMTAPVEMGYTDAPGEAPAMSTMAFLYRSPEIGSPADEGAVRVEDLPARTFASVGVRGRYTTSSFEKGLRLVDGWLEGQDQWVRAGEPRYLGYNGPFVPWFARYGEVQVPVERR